MQAAAAEERQQSVDEGLFQVKMADVKKVCVCVEGGGRRAMDDDEPVAQAVQGAMEMCSMQSDVRLLLFPPGPVHNI